jgi:hypothetical protein
MTLKNACEIAESCGLETIGEAVFNIELHALNVFSYAEMDAEMKELRNEYESFCKDHVSGKDTPISILIN